MKTQQRTRFESEVEVIKSKIGDLSSVQNQLSLSGRKMSQLLMIDPSTWTRWIKGEVNTPPHIYRSLQWYMALIEKHPEWHPQNTFQKSFNDEVGAEMKVEIEKLMILLKKTEQRQLWLSYLVFALSLGLFCLIYLVFR